MMPTILIHPFTGQDVHVSGVVGNVYKSRTQPGEYSIRVHQANTFVDLADAGKFLVAVGGEHHGGIYATADEAHAEAESWIEAYPDASVAVIEIREDWGTRAL